eukprot:6212241-Pleurochrysis_carterae.AAC.6
MPRLGSNGRAPLWIVSRVRRRHSVRERILRWASGRVHSGISQERSERGEELAYVQGGLGLRSHRVCGLESRVIVNEYKNILEPAVPCASERSGNVGVH